MDGSTPFRELLGRGYEPRKEERAADKYRGGVTLSKTAEKAGITAWEMEEFLGEPGHKSEYSVKDLEMEAF